MQAQSERQKVTKEKENRDEPITVKVSGGLGHMIEELDTLLRVYPWNYLRQLVVFSKRSMLS